MKKRLLLIIFLLSGFTGCSNDESGFTGSFNYECLKNHENYNWINKYNEDDIEYLKVTDLYTSFPGGVNKVYYTEDETNIEYVFDFLDCEINVENSPNRYSPPTIYEYTIYMKDGNKYSFRISDGYLYYYNDQEINIDKKSNYFNTSISLEFNKLSLGECRYSFNNIRNPFVYINDEKKEEYVRLENLEFIKYEGQIEGDIIKSIIGDDHIIDVYQNGVFTFRYKNSEDGINYQLIDCEF
jgi:hypothetical protein